MTKLPSTDCTRHRRSLSPQHLPPLVFTADVLSTVFSLKSPQILPPSQNGHDTDAANRWRWRGNCGGLPPCLEIVPQVQQFPVRDRPNRHHHRPAQCSPSCSAHSSHSTLHPTFPDTHTRSSCCCTSSGSHLERNSVGVVRMGDFLAASAPTSTYSGNHRNYYLAHREEIAQKRKQLKPWLSYYEQHAEEERSRKRLAYQKKKAAAAAALTAVAASAELESAASPPTAPSSVTTV